MLAWRQHDDPISSHNEDERDPAFYSDAESHGMADWRRRHAFSFKVLAYLLTITFLVYDITWAQGGQPLLWQNARPTVKLNGSAPINDIKIPYNAGQPQNAYSNGGDEIILNIQDAHASLAAQDSVLTILDSLSTNYDLSVIALEGAEGPIDVDLLRTFPDPDVKKDTGRFLMREGKMSAGEFFAIVSDKPVKLYGIENEPLYKANVESFNEVIGMKLECISNLDKLDMALKALEPKIYSSDLSEFCRDAVLHQEGKLSFAKYWACMQKLASANNVQLLAYTNINKLLTTIDLEKEIDFQKANTERKALIDELMKTLPKRELEKLVLESLSFKLGKVSQGDFHQYIVRLAEDMKVSPEPYSNLIRFANYITIYEDIDIAGLFAETEELESAIREKLFRNDDQRILFNLIKAVSVLKK